MSNNNGTVWMIAYNCMQDIPQSVKQKMVPMSRRPKVGVTSEATAGGTSEGRDMTEQRARAKR